MEIPGLHPSLQLVLVLVNPTRPMELQKEPRSSLLFYQGISSLPYTLVEQGVTLPIHLATRSPWGRGREHEEKQAYGRVKRGGATVELDIG